MQIPNGTGPGVQRSKRSLSACLNMFYGTYQKSVKRSNSVTRSMAGVINDRWRVSLYMVMLQNVIKQSGKGNIV